MAKRSAAKGPSQRQLRVGELLRHTLADILLRGDIADPELNELRITISQVSPSPDMRHATVYVQTAQDQMKQALEVLSRHKKFLRGELGRRVELKYVPELRFAADTSIDTGERIDAILRSPEVARDLD
ncbi:30S ribosome-binding factor RbfA [Dichotomicrobium thermohalophilum]|uniref:Ribosome-binding factor A n=1 Tax=Dichotomicrobium thermohalophilum TaxID=933063 RepID=A0A397PNP6_9HYPH|nr:30S ribosome-binding factor RbfA [Dichotomicrobium thermohalophilum]RIA47361.1 ribosome-binding factor A [Dichotomicrobium thermohalophilum]